MQYGTKGKCPIFFYEDFFMFLGSSTFVVMSVFFSTVQFIPCQNSNMWQIRQCRQLNHAWRFRQWPGELSWSACSMATKQKLAEWDVTELVLELDSDAHSSEDEDISPHSGSDANGITDTNCTQRADSAHTRPAVPVVHRFTGGPCGLQQMEAPHITKHLPT
jgi:hypothetical protein